VSERCRRKIPIVEVTADSTYPLASSSAGSVPRYSSPFSPHQRIIECSDEKICFDHANHEDDDEYQDESKDESKDEREENPMPSCGVHGVTPLKETIEQGLPVGAVVNPSILLPNASVPEPVQARTNHDDNAVAIHNSQPEEQEDTLPSRSCSPRFANLLDDDASSPAMRVGAFIDEKPSFHSFKYVSPTAYVTPRKGDGSGLNEPMENLAGQSTTRAPIIDYQSWEYATPAYVTPRKRDGSGLNEPMENLAGQSTRSSRVIDYQSWEYAKPIDRNHTGRSPFALTGKPPEPPGLPPPIAGYQAGTCHAPATGLTCTSTVLEVESFDSVDLEYGVNLDLSLEPRGDHEPRSCAAVALGSWLLSGIT